MAMAMLALQDKHHCGVIDPTEEIAAYESLWVHNSTVKKMSDVFRRYNHEHPSVVAYYEGISIQEIEETKDHVRRLMPFRHFGSLFYRDFDYPKKLRDARNPVEVLYYRGLLDLLSSRTVSIVGARKASEVGIRRARRIARLLVDNQITVMSGLAEGIDTAAHKAALEFGGRTIAVIGTSLNDAYPRNNRELQNLIAQEHLVVSQVPFYQSSQQDYRINRGFFPERNKTMSALSEATIIVEASETSGSLIQARAAIEQSRKLFILKSCFAQGLSWPERFREKGAIVLEDANDLLRHFES
jgi:DNA processing protein